jgi:hypothetical protein
MNRKPDTRTPEERRKAGRQASPWNRGPMCETARARAAHMRYVKRGKAMRTEQ